VGVCSIILLLSSEEVILSISNREISSSSFRDPSGSVFCENNEVYRQVNLVYKPHYDLLIESGLYEALIQSDLLIAHEEIEFRIEIEQQKIYMAILNLVSTKFVNPRKCHLFPILMNGASVSLKTPL
jgi:hypothetical protein